MTLKRPLIGTAVFVIKNWKFLLGKRKSNHWDKTWCIPWGHLEFWETYQECWARETYEEAGVTIKDIEFLWISNDIGIEKHYVTIFMKSNYKSWTADITDFDEFHEWIWVDLDSLPDNLFYIFEDFLNNNKELIKKYLINSNIDDCK